MSFKEEFYKGINYLIQEAIPDIYNELSPFLRIIILLLLVILLLFGISTLFKKIHKWIKKRRAEKMK